MANGGTASNDSLQCTEALTGLWFFCTAELEVVHNDI